MNSLDFAILIVSILNLALNATLTWLYWSSRQQARGSGLGTSQGAFSGFAGLRPSSAHSSNAQRPIIVNPKSPLDLKIDRQIQVMETRGEEPNLDALLEDEGSV